MLPKNHTNFAFKSAAYITLIASIVLALMLYLGTDTSLWIVLWFAIALYSMSFFILQYRVEFFIYRRIKKIYDDVSLLESTSFQNQPVTTDMVTLTREIEKFAKDKKLEIETLKVQRKLSERVYGKCFS